MIKQQRSLATGLKLAVCLIAILAIAYAQTLIESWGGGYGGPGANASLLGPDIYFVIYSDVIIWLKPIPIHWDPYSYLGSETRIVIGTLLILLSIVWWCWWHNVWTEPLRRERLLAAELRPMHRLVSSPIRPTRKAAGGNKHKHSLIRTPVWP
jgi:hypothetical protein